uniref:Uncharacterized protein n=1 Tax=Arundo donax TaxID=35708 RepID=A0A0A9AJQ9_ARUDO
MQRFALLSGK